MKSNQLYHLWQPLIKTAMDSQEGRGHCWQSFQAAPRPSKCPRMNIKVLPETSTVGLRSSRAISKLCQDSCPNAESRLCSRPKYLDRTQQRIEDFRSRHAGREAPPFHHSDEILGCKKHSWNVIEPRDEIWRSYSCISLKLLTLLPGTICGHSVQGLIKKKLYLAPLQAWRRLDPLPKEATAGSRPEKECKLSPTLLLATPEQWT